MHTLFGIGLFLLSQICRCRYLSRWVSKNPLLWWVNEYSGRWTAYQMYQKPRDPGELGKPGCSPACGLFKFRPVVAYLSRCHGVSGTPSTWFSSVRCERLLCLVMTCWAFVAGAGAGAGRPQGPRGQLGVALRLPHPGHLDGRGFHQRQWVRLFFLLKSVPFYRTHRGSDGRTV